MSVKERWVRLFWRSRVVLLLLVGLLTLCLGSGLPRLKIDNAVQVWFVEDDPALLRYEAFQDAFGNDEVVAIAFYEEEGVLSEDGVAALTDLSHRIEQIDGISEVRSLSTLEHLRLQEDWPAGSAELPPLVVAPLIAGGESTERLTRRVNADPLVRKLLSDDLKTTLIVAQMGDRETVDLNRDAIVAQLTEVVSSRPMAGIGVIFSALNTASNRDIAYVGTLSYGLIFFLLFLLYRRLSPVLLTIGVVVLSEIITLGLMGWLDIRLNTVTTLLPTVVLIIGIADCVHLLRAVQARPEVVQSERAILGISEVFWPCLFTSLTTAAGFLALTTARMAVIRHLGLFGAVATLVTFVVTLIVLLNALNWSVFEPKPRSDHLLKRALLRVEAVVFERTSLILGVGLATLLLSAIGVARITADTYSIDFFYADHPVRVDSAFVEEHFGPYTPLEFVLSSPESMRNVADLRAIERWMRVVQTDPRVGQSQSVVDPVARLNQLLLDGAPQSFVVPDDDAMLEQSLLMVDESDLHLSQWVNADWTELRVTFWVKMMSANAIDEALRDIQASADLPAQIVIHPNGYLPLYVTMMDYVVSSQLTSFSVALAAIFALLVGVFGSLRMALFSLPPNLFPVFLTLGFMGFMGIHLDVATVTIAAVIQGLVVDDTMHFMYRFRDALHRLGSHDEAVRETLRTVGVPISTTSVILTLGFLTLGAATVKSVAFFGLLVAIAMGSALLGDLLILPALLITLKPRL